MSEKLEQLKERLGEVADINHAASVLGWDQQVNMPPMGNEARGQQLATLSKIAQEKFIADEVGRLIEDLKQEYKDADPESDEAALIRVTARDYDKARRVPPEFIQEQAIVSSKAFEAWMEARSKSDFSIFQPHLEQEQVKADVKDKNKAEAQGTEAKEQTEIEVKAEKEKGSEQEEAAAVTKKEEARVEKGKETKNQVKTGSAMTNGTNAAKKMVTIEKVTLQGGTVNFSDRYIKPNFSTTMLELGGRVTGLSSEETKIADVEMRGKLDNYAPLEITGKINPLREDLFVDLNISFTDMDLSPLTPYSGRYLGYVIEKGKLGLNLHYLIEKKKLDSQNKILLDQFTLGKQVDSPDATKLPVRLAIALLKNRRGEIDLDIPVSGQIDDPKFSIGRIIIKILLDLLVKAATR